MEFEENAVPQDRQHHLDTMNEWASMMRIMFSIPEVYNEDGSLNQQYFRPPMRPFKRNSEWNDADTEKLYEGIVAHGVGEWTSIQKEFLPEWTENQIRVRTCKLLVRKNVSEYSGLKLTKADVERIKSENTELGKKKMNMGYYWNNGLLIKDQDIPEACRKDASSIFWR